MSRPTKTCNPILRTRAQKLINAAQALQETAADVKSDETAVHLVQLAQQLVQIAEAIQPGDNHAQRPN